MHRQKHNSDRLGLCPLKWIIQSSKYSAFGYPVLSEIVLLIFVKFGIETKLKWIVFVNQRFDLILPIYKTL